MSETERELLTVKEAASLAKIHQLTLYRLIKSGKVQALKFGGTYRLRHDFLDKIQEKYDGA